MNSHMPSVEHKMVFEVLPDKSSQIISVGLSHDLKDYDENRIKAELKQVYIKNSDVYKALFKSFSNNTFIYREHYALKFKDDNIDEAFEFIKGEKKIITENIKNFFTRLNRDEIDVKFAIFYGLIETLMPKFESKLKEQGFAEVIDKDGQYKIFLNDKDIFLLSTLNWVNYGSYVMDFIYSFHKEFSKEFNPHLTRAKIEQFENRLNLEILLINADKNLTIHTTTRVDFPLKAKSNAIKENLIFPFLLTLPAIILVMIFSIMNSFTIGAISSMLMLVSVGGTLILLLKRGYFY